ncbi:MAG TPA: hypothetical protein VHD61_12675 [Lacunisphaera sp.]|nr:hypothetical protein [Lacunisphaera sp.]
MTKRTLAWTAVAALAGALGLAGFWLLFSTFQVYDDEGYVLLSLQNFSLHGGLYDHVYSQYGPFIYLLYDGLHRALGFAFTNTSGRWITLVNWLGAAAACAALVGRQTRSARWTAFTLAGVFTYLWVMINEPVHPGGLLVLLVALGAWLGTEAWTAGRIGRFAALTAAIGAALALTKINVGVFFLGAAFAWLALNTAAPRPARALAWLVALGAAALPFALMRALFAEPWVRTYAVVFTAGLLALLLAARETIRPAVGARAWAWFAGALLGAAAVIAGAALIRGTSLRGLLDGVVIEPMKHPGVYFFAMKWRIGTAPLALASVALAAAATRAGGTRRPGFRGFVAAARLVAGAVFLCCPLQIISTSLAAWGMCYGIALAWLFVLPLRDDDRGAPARAWIALLLVFQFLHAYPVAGSQVNWGTFLWIPLLALGLRDAAPVWQTWGVAAGRCFRCAGTLVLVAVTVTMPAQLARIGWTQYSRNPPLGLPGAENLRLTSDMVYSTRIMRENLRTHADLLFSFPGLYSANLWTGLPTPTLSNATHWFSLLPPARQQEIVDRLDAAPRSALLVQRDVLDYLAKSGFHPSGPLLDWLMAHYEKTLALDGYELWLRHGRQVALFSTGRLTTTASDAPQVLELTLAPTTAPITRIELCDYFAPRLPLAEIGGAEPDISLQPISPDGRPLGALQSAHFPVTLTAPVRMTIRYRGVNTPIARNHGLAVLRDSTGAIVAEARLLD